MLLLVWLGAVMECVCVFVSHPFGFLLRGQMGFLPLSLLTPLLYHVLSDRHGFIKAQGSGTVLCSNQTHKRWRHRPYTKPCNTTSYSGKLLKYTIQMLVRDVSSLGVLRNQPCLRASCVSSRETTSSDSGEKIDVGLREGGRVTCWWAASPADSLGAAV